MFSVPPTSLLVMTKRTRHGRRRVTAQSDGRSNRALSSMDGRDLLTRPMLLVPYGEVEENPKLPRGLVIALQLPPQGAHELSIEVAVCRGSWREQEFLHQRGEIAQ